MNAYSRYECFKSRQDYPPTSRGTLLVSGRGNESTASSAGCIKTGYFIIFHIDKSKREREIDRERKRESERKKERGREEKSGEHDENNGGRRRRCGVVEARRVRD